MELKISGLHPVTGEWIVLQNNTSKNVELTIEEIQETLSEYTKLISEFVKTNPDNGCQVTIARSTLRIIFDPRKFLAIKVELE